MRRFRMFAIALIVGAGVLIAGCGGEGGGLGPTIFGFYIGQTAGDGHGQIRFTVSAGRALNGNMTVPPVCDRQIGIGGSVDGEGRVNFAGGACGISFTGTGLIELDPVSNRYRGAGTWTGNNGTSGTWSCDWRGRTGSITCPI